MKNADMPAHPYGTDKMIEAGANFKGLSKLEHFAGLAMQGLLAADIDCIAEAGDLARASILYAKALLSELEKADES